MARRRLANKRSHGKKKTTSKQKEQLDVEEVILVHDKPTPEEQRQGEKPQTPEEQPQGQTTQTEKEQPQGESPQTPEEQPQCETTKTPEEQTQIPEEETETPEVQHTSDEIQDQPETPEVQQNGFTEGNLEDENATAEAQPPLKRRRGPTRMKDIAKDPNARIQVEFTQFGEPCGLGSVKLSSYLGPLVREHVPIIIEDWRKVNEDIKTVLWKSVQTRFELDDEYQRNAVMKQMGCLWRASKSRVVGQITSAKNNQERMKLRPKNVPPTEWRKFVKLKTSEAFKVVSEEYKKRRSKQIPHTCSRKGMVRLTEDMKKEETEPSSVTRLKVWVKSRTKKDGTPVNTNAAEKIRKAADVITANPSSLSTNPKDDLLSQVLGQDNPGRLRAMGRGMSMTKLACFQIKNKVMAQMEEKQINLQQQVADLQAAISRMRKQEPEVGENSGPRSVNKQSQPKCILVDWAGTDEVVADGRFISSDPEEFVNGVPLGPNSAKVLVETATKPDTFLWRPAANIHNVEQAVGEMIAWPANNCIIPDKLADTEDIPLMSPTSNSMNKCKLLDWISDDEVVAEGRWLTREPKALVNGLPLGPNAIKVFVDEVLKPETFLWRPTSEMRNLDDCFKSFVAWPANRVVLETNTSETPPSPRQKSRTPPPEPSKRNSPEPIDKLNHKIKMMDITGKNEVVAEGRWVTDNPDEIVHFVPLGPKGVRVWVDVVKEPAAEVWRPTVAVECMEDAFGSTIAWPADKVVFC